MRRRSLKDLGGPNRIDLPQSYRNEFDALR
jgi:hypothetical protein